MAHHEVEPEAALGSERDEATRVALGALSEALETVERARGHLYTFHQLSGTADFTLEKAIRLLRAAGQEALAQRLDAELLGRNVLEGRWSYQLVEEYDDTYWSVFREFERSARNELADGHRHVHEAALKAARRSHGRRHHEPTPTSELGPSGDDTER